MAQLQATGITGSLNISGSQVMSGSLTFIDAGRITMSSSEATRIETSAPGHKYPGLGIIATDIFGTSSTFHTGEILLGRIKSGNMATGDIAGYLIFREYFTSSFSNLAYIYAEKDGSAGRLKFNVSGDRLTITSNGQITAPEVYNTAVTGRDVYVSTAGLIGYISSIQASKININPITDTSWLMNLNPVAFNYRKKDINDQYTDEFEPEVEYGLIAEEVEIINKDLCFYDETEDGEILRGIHYKKLITPMLKLLQQQQEQIDNLIQEINILKSQ
jgi:hypothetical protein